MLQIPAGPLVAVGDLVWDVLLQTDTTLLRGGDTTGNIALAPGGSAANVAVWWARMGRAAHFVGSVGADRFGDLILQDIRQEGVTAQVTQLTGANTGVIVALVEHDGQRSMITNQGADFLLQPEHVPVATMAQAAAVHVTGWSLFHDPPRSAALHAAQLARQAGAYVSLDPASFQMIRDGRDSGILDVFRAVQADILFPNRDEGTELTGQHDPALVTQTLRHMFGCQMVVLKLDRDGCFVDTGTHTAHYPAHAITAVDSTGAGDAFDAAFLAEYQRHGDIERAAYTANRMAAWVVARVGARPPVDQEWLDIAHNTPPV